MPDIIFSAVSQPPYVPPDGDAVIFGGAAAQYLEMSAVVDLGIVATADARAVLPVSAIVDLGIQASASMGGLLSVAATVDMAVSVGATTILGMPVSAQVDMAVTAAAQTAPSWYIPAPFGGSYRARWTDGTKTEHRTRHPHRQAPVLEPETALPWGELQHTQRQAGQPWRAIPPRNRSAAAPWGDLRQTPQRTAGMAYDHPEPRNREHFIVPWGGVLESRAARLLAGYCYPQVKDGARRLPWDALHDLARQTAAAYSVPPPVDVFVPIVSGPHWYPRWCINRYDPPAGDGIVFAASAGYVVPAGDALIFADLSSNYPRHCYDGTWTGPKDPYWYKPRSWNIARPNIRRVYYVMNTVTLTRIADGVPIPVEGLSVGTDRDSWAWSLNATLVRKADLDLVRPTGGAPVEVEATINGLSWRFAIEEYGEETRWGGRAYTATGRSLSAYLADPYSAPRDLIQTQQRTAQQLAEDELTDTGFSIAWSLPEWLIPGGVWSYQGQTPIQAIAQIAAVAGGVVQSHPSTQQLIIQPWYTAMPWNWGGVAIDAVVPAAMIDSRRSRFEPRPAYTGVYCRGQQQGVTCFVRRTGSDGSRLAGQQVHNLITATEPGLALGKKILADSGARSIETLNLPLLDNPGLLTPGAIIEVQDTAETWRGKVIRTNIAAARPAVNQAIDVLRYHGS